MADYRHKSKALDTSDEATNYRKQLMALEISNEAAFRRALTDRNLLLRTRSVGTRTSTENRASMTETTTHSDTQTPAIGTPTAHIVNELAVSGGLHCPSCVCSRKERHAPPRSQSRDQPRKRRRSILSKIEPSQEGDGGEGSSLARELVDANHQQALPSCMELSKSLETSTQLPTTNELPPSQ
jgi:hypothetical protein